MVYQGCVYQGGIAGQAADGIADERPFDLGHSAWGPDGVASSEHQSFYLELKLPGVEIDRRAPAYNEPRLAAAG